MPGAEGTPLFTIFYNSIENFFLDKIFRVLYLLGSYINETFIKRTHNAFHKWMLLWDIIGIKGRFISKFWSKAFSQYVVSIIS